ncbi:MAG: hypothetical protein ABIQ16_01525 [Polyangiaceae bacterium]
MPVNDHSAFSTRSPFARTWRVLSSKARALGLVGAAATLALGCTPKIGDECTVSTNCSATGDRLCDITQPGGYCTVFNCEPGTCPADSVCINFGTTSSSVAPVCAPSQGNSPYQRSFCMATCGSDGDCRGLPYVCKDLSGAPDKPTNSLGAVLAEYSGDGKVCVVNPAAAPSLAAGGTAGAGGLAGSAGKSFVGVDTGVCTGFNGGASSGGASNGGAGN